jgi:hypothetical protein
MINEFKFFEGVINNDIRLFQTRGSLDYFNLAGEMISAASNLGDRVRELEEEIRYIRDHVNTILDNE